MSLEGPWFPDPALGPSLETPHKPRLCPYSRLPTLSLHILAHTATLSHSLCLTHPHWPPGPRLLPLGPLEASASTFTLSVLCQLPEQGRPCPCAFSARSPLAAP